VDGLRGWMDRLQLLLPVECPGSWALQSTSTSSSCSRCLQQLLGRWPCAAAPNQHMLASTAYPGRERPPPPPPTAALLLYMLPPSIVAVASGVALGSGVWMLLQGIATNARGAHDHLL
jgi:hypothetical protein